VPKTAATKESIRRPNRSHAIQLRGARVHNLKSIDVDIQLGALVVVCGVSGSGKTSLAFDTLYAEGQRRYIESFSSYARQFLQRLDRPEYDSLENLPPSIAVTRTGASRNNRSIISSTTEIDDYLRLLYAKFATIQCVDCGSKVERDSPTLLQSWILSDTSDLRAIPTFALHWENQADLALQLAHLQNSGYVRLIVGDEMFNISEDNRDELAMRISSTDRIHVAVDRLTTGSEASRWSEALENAFEWGDGTVTLYVQQIAQETELNGRKAKQIRSITGSNFLEFDFHEDLVCGTCSKEYPHPDQRLFSFNSPIGACTMCEGLAEIQELDMNKIVPDSNKSIRAGAIAPWNTPSYAHELEELLSLADDEQIDVDKPYKQLNDREKKLIFDGVKRHAFGGLRGFFAWLERKKYKMHIRIYAARWHSYRSCPQCGGKRLRDEALAFKIDGQSISELNARSVDDLYQFFKQLIPANFQRGGSTTILDQIKARLKYLKDVGLGYLQLDRPLRTLSGGELTRVNLTGVLGSNLVDMLYVLDEPTVGLHPSDSSRLIDVILQLRDRGNTVLVVEHESPMILKADQLIEVGPLASRRGGEIVFSGPPAKLKAAKTLTARYLFAKNQQNTLRRNRTAKNFLRLTNASGNNLRGIDLNVPLGCLCVVSGVSGSGKSSLINETFYPAVLRRLNQEGETPLAYDKLTGSLNFDECLMIDQGVATRSSRSVPVTLVKAFDDIRNVFAQTRDAVAGKLTSSSFSFNNAEGRCSTCEGNGSLEVDMVFLADVQVVCPDCHGKRFRPEVLAVRYRDRNIAEVLDMNVSEAIEFFRGEPKIQERLAVLTEVGLDYIQLGQTSSTLSAGEAQRLKLANYLVQSSNRRALIIMDEPTTGLHFYDVEKLIQCMQKLIDAGNSLIVVEHNEQILNAADWIIDIGPGAAEQGGSIVAEGTPDQVAQSQESKTATYLVK
jgi:excinuclease ABC subunit A